MMNLLNSYVRQGLGKTKNLAIMRGYETEEAFRANIEAACRDCLDGRTYPAEEVFAELREKYGINT